MNYPLLLNFKKLAIARQLSVEDASGALLLYVKQKAFKLKEAVTVYADREQTVPVYEIKADRIIDFNAAYRITAMNGAELGVVQQRGMRSIWRATFEITRGGTILYEMREENPWVKVLDGIFSEIPFVGLLSGYVLSPRYLVHRSDGVVVLNITKKPAFLQGKFEITRAATPLPDMDEQLVITAVLMILLLEKNRG
jgi:hypothetical protein